MKFDTTNILIIVAALIVAAGAYWFFFMNTNNALPLSPGVAPSTAQARFQALVSELAPISFDTSVLSDPRFLNLKDITTPMTPVNVGRLDPFAPVPGVSVISGA